MSTPADRSRARRNLALRAERAFGLSAVKRQNDVAPPIVPPRNVAAPVAGRPLAPPTRPAAASVAAPRALFTPAPIDLASSPLPREQKIIQLQQLDESEVRGCTRCRLCEQRTQTVFGEGDPDAKIFFVGEGPGQNEDEQGRPFVGRSGELLNKWIAAMGLRREMVYIANIVKCRPPGNREPAPDEAATCTPYLEHQLAVIRPSVIMTLGRPAAQHMLGIKILMGKIRGQWQTWRGIALLPTYHPAYVLRNYTYETRSAVWNDLQSVMKRLELPMPVRKSDEQS